MDVSKHRKFVVRNQAEKAAFEKGTVFEQVLASNAGQSNLWRGKIDQPGSGEYG